MGRKNDARTPLTEAAAALEAELSRFEALARETEAVPLDSEKNFGRAARLMQETADCQERTAGLVRALVEAIHRARDRQQTIAQALLARAEELKSRTELLEVLLDRFRALGVEARDVQALVVNASERGAARDVEGTLSMLEQARDRLGSLAGRAEDLARDAREKGIADVEREADSLRQQLTSAKNKLGLLEKSFNRQPS